MNFRKSFVLVAFVICGLMLSACENQSIQAEENEPVTLEKIDGSDLNRVILSEHAAQRLDIQTVPVSETTMNEQSYLVVPYSAIIYDLVGDVWIYVNPAQLTYQREQVVVENIEGDLAYLSEGPPVGTLVVAIGAPELYGADTGVGK